MNLIVKLFVFLSLVGLATSRRVPKLVEVDKGFTGFGLPSVDMNKEEVVGDDKKNTMEVKEVKHVKSKVVKKDEGKRVGWGLNHLPTFEEIDGFE